MKQKILVTMLGYAACAAALLPATSDVAADESQPAATAQTSHPPDVAQPVIEEVIVTAQKRSENLQLVPVSVTAISAEDLQRRGIDNLGKLVGVSLPGVYMQPMSGQKSFVLLDIRGVVTPDPTQGTIDASTAIIEDDVYSARGGGAGFNPAEVERIELLRGPQGTLFGRNAEGGALRVVTKQPTGVLEGNVKVGFGNYDTRSQEAHINFPELSGLSFKLDVKHEENDGDTKNASTPLPIGLHFNPGQFQGDGYKLSALWKITRDFTATYAYTYSRLQSTKGINQKGVPPAVCQGGVACAAAITSVATPLFVSADHHVDTSWLGFYMGPDNVENTVNRLGLEWKLQDNLTLKSITATHKSTDLTPGNNDAGAFSLVSFGAAGVPGSFFKPALGTSGIAAGGFTAASQLYGAAGIVSYAKVKSDQISQEFQLLGESEHTKWVTGLYYFKEDAEDSRDNTFTVLYQGFSGGHPINPISTNPFFVGASSLSVTQSHVNSWAGFGQLTWTPESNDKLHLTGGLRYSHDHRTFHRSVNAGLPSNIDQPTIDKGRIDGNVSLAYDLTDTVNAYTRFGTAYRAGGSSVRAPWTGPLASFATYHEEVLHSWEAGIKSELFERRLRLNVAAYVNWIKGQLLNVQIIPTNNTITATINLPGTTVTKGVEMEAAYAVTDRLMLSGNLTLPTYELSSDTKNYIATKDPGSAYYITGEPKWMAGVAGDYKMPVEPGQLVFHIDWSKSAKSIGTGRVPAANWAPELWIDQANARMTLEDVKAGQTSLKFSVYVNNMFNTIHPIFTTPQNSWVSSFPRTYGAEVSAAF